MRHLYTNRVVVILATLLLMAAALLAWSRSRPTAPAPTSAGEVDATQPTMDDADGRVTGVDSAQLAAGQHTWSSQCARCHRATDSESVVPARLGERTRQLAMTDEGRSALVRLLLDGTAADSAESRWRHPTYVHLSDQDLRDLLNLMLYEDVLGGATPEARPAAYTLGEVARLRAPNAESPATDAPR